MTQRNIREINEDPLLRAYGQCLSALFAFTALFWSYTYFVSGNDRTGLAHCFPQMPYCAEFNALYRAWPWLEAIHLWAIAACGTLAFLDFRHKRASSAGAWLMGALLLKTVWTLRTYQHMGNYHYMPVVMTGAFLFGPNKRALCALLVVLFYVSAGFLKFNLEWLSGAAYFTQTWIPPVLLAPLTFLIPTLEVSGAWLLLSKIRSLRRFGLLIFGIFHFVSYFFVGIFYPVTMFALLGILWLPEIKSSWWREEQVSRKALAICAGFMFMQFAPLLLVTDPALSGVPRLVSLNMFDANTACGARIEVTRGRDYRIVPVDPVQETRLRCDPIAFASQLARICALGENARVHGELWSKRKSDRDYKLTFYNDNACRLGRAIYWGEML